MKKRLLFFPVVALAASIALLLAANVDAQTFFNPGNQTIVGNTLLNHNNDGARPIHAGVKIGSGDVGRWTDSGWGLVAGSGSPYHLDNVVIDLNETTDAFTVAGIATDASNGMFNLGSGVLNVSGNVIQTSNFHTLRGFIYINDTDFNGTIVGDERVLSVTATGGDADAIGVHFRNLMGGNRDIGSSAAITFGDIAVNHAGTGDAFGFAAGAVASDATIHLGSVSAATNGSQAAGVEFRGDVLGNLTIDSLQAEARHRAVGLTVTSGTHLVNADLGSTGNRASIGEINVRTMEAGRGGAIGVNDGAYGIFVDQGDAFLNLRGNITAIAEHAGGHAFGIGGGVGGNADIRLEESIAIYGTTAGIWTRGDLTIDLNGNNLTTNSVWGDSTGHIFGTGRANLGTVDFFGDTTIGDGDRATVVAIDMPSSWLPGTNTLQRYSTLEVYGEIPTDWLWLVPPGSYLAHLEGEGNFVNSAIFTNYQWRNGGIFFDGYLDRANVNDGFLAASQIHHRLTAWNAVRDHLISGVSGVGMARCGHFGQARCMGGCCNDNRNVWINYIGRDSRYRSSFNGNDWRLTSNGVQLGTDFFRTPRAQLGMFFGYEDSTARNIGDRIKGNDYYVGIYGVHVFRNGADLRTVFSTGWQDFNTQRHGADGDLYRMKFRGNTAEVNIELGQRHYFWGWSSRPSIALDWYLSHLDIGRETAVGNGVNALRYNSTDLSQLFFRFGTDLRYEWGRLMLDSGLYYSYDMLGNELRTGVSNADRTLHSTLVGSQLGRSVVSYNIGGSWIVNHRFAIFGGYRGEYRPEHSGRGVTHIGHVGGALRW